MKPILEIQTISKKFSINKQQEPYLSLREHLKKIFKSKEKHEDFWALKDVSFDVYPGESIGIIGKNGAGKSTLLKILSKITPPTSGKIISRGRIASLLEVGTGFHPELTGRENIYLNGSILGLRRAEITKHFDAIIDFSGVEQFIDTPLKRYSSGMQLRLAFAVAAHLEPEVLIIDEVLAVGDAEFQKKCLGKMGEVSKSGRTVLFVSHDLEAVTKLCTKSVVLHKGRMEFFDISLKATEFYHNLSKTSDTNGSFYNQEDQIFFEKITIPNRTINTGDDLEIDIEILQKHLQKNAVLNVNITDHMGNLIAHMINYDDNHQTIQSKTIKATINEINLPIGIYNLSFWAGLDSFTPIEHLPNILSFEIKSVGHYIKRNSNVPPNARMILKSKWE